jgi:hypothetical protein
MPDDKTVANITQPTRDDSQYRDPGPGPSKPRAYLKDRGRLCVGGVIRNQNNTGQLLRAAQVLLDHSLADR